MELKKVFEPGKIGNLELKNRLAVRQHPLFIGFRGALIRRAGAELLDDRIAAEHFQRLDAARAPDLIEVKRALFDRTGHHHAGQGSECHLVDAACEVSRLNLGVGLLFDMRPDDHGAQQKDQHRPDHHNQPYPNLLIPEPIHDTPEIQ